MTAPTAVLIRGTGVGAPRYCRRKPTAELTDCPVASITPTDALIAVIVCSVEGTPFGRYQLLELLGRGGMGEVWRAYDTTIDRVVALKMLLPHFAQDPDFDKRFRREARAAARLDEPHVVPIHDVGEVDGRLYVTMRLINGTDLQSLLDTGPLEPNRAVHIVEQIASALHSAHQAGLVHRDVKPSNILIADNDFAYLIDFGIARSNDDTGLTSEGSTIGTWAYMAPERFSSGSIGPSSDVYALACVLYQSLTGELPFPGTTLEQVAVGHIITPPPRPSERRATVPAALDDVIITGLAKQPDDRYQSAIEMASAARQAITDPMIRPPVGPLTSTPSQPNPTGAAGHPQTQPYVSNSGPATPAPMHFSASPPPFPTSAPPQRFPTSAPPTPPHLPTSAPPQFRASSPPPPPPYYPTSSPPQHSKDSLRRRRAAAAFSSLHWLRSR